MTQLHQGLAAPGQVDEGVADEADQAAGHGAVHGSQQGQNGVLQADVGVGHRAGNGHKTPQNKEQCRADTDSDNGLDAAVVIFHILSPLLFRGCGVSCKASLVYDTLLSLVNGQSARFAEKRLLSCIWGRMLPALCSKKEHPRLPERMPCEC